MLKALVRAPNEKTDEYGSLLAVARDEVHKREYLEVNLPIRALQFVQKIRKLELFSSLFETVLITTPIRRIS